MEMHHLRSFVAVAEEGNLSRAADRLYASQPTISAHVKTLEEELGLLLFTRTPSGMVPTPAGAQLMERAKSILSAVQDLNRDAMMLREEFAGPVSIGLNTDAVFLKIEELLTAIGKNLPGAKLQLQQSCSDHIVSDIRSRKLDAGFAFYSIPYAEVVGVAVKTTRIVLAAPPGWEDRIKDRSFSELAKLPWVLPALWCPDRKLLERAFQQHGASPHQIMEADHEELIRRLVSSGKGVSLMREDEAEEGQHQGKLIYRYLGEEFQADLYFVFHRDRAGDPLINRLKQLIQQVFAKENQG
jgi:DNA-binding transcriptional LysR family regulator